MAINIGSSADMQREARGDFTDRVKLVEGPNIHRILFGPVRQKTVWYPTLVEDEDGSMKQSMRAFKPPETGSPLDALASLEKRVRRNKGEEKPKSSLDPRNRWLYLVINLESEEYPKVEIAEYPWSVFDALVSLEKAEHPKDKTKLRHGLLFMFDVIITKKVNPKLPPQFGTKYEVEPDPDNPFTGKIPKSYWGKTASELAEHGIDLEDFFPEEMWQAIQEAEIDLQAEAAPDSIEDIKAKLEEFPIFLGATDDAGNYRFPAISELADQAEKLGIAHFLGEGDAERPKLSSGEEKEEKIEVDEEESGVEIEDDDNTEDADFEDEGEEDEGEEDEEETPPPKPSGKKPASEKPKTPSKFPEW